MIHRLKSLFRKNNNRKLNLVEQLKINYGSHRSGWHYALQGLKPLHNPNGVLFDSFVERTFVWNPKGVKPHREPWVGVIHVPPHVPGWFLYHQANESIFKTDAWQQSLPLCRGLFTLSENHKNHLQKRLDIPVNNLFFATETPTEKWSWEKFQENPRKKIIQVGWWLRKLHTIFQLQTNKYEKIFLKASHVRRLEELIGKEREILVKQGQFHDNMYDTAQTIDFLSDSDYDHLLSENIAIINLYDTSANNVIAECIVRNAPILVNPLPAVVEYLGSDYPLYFNTLEEAVEKAENFDLIHKTHLFLLQHPSKEKLDNSYFYRSVKESGIYQNL